MLIGTIQVTKCAGADEKVLEAQKWLNKTYRGKTGYVSIKEDGKAGICLSERLVCALQIELGTSKVTGVFGPETKGKFKKECGKLKLGDEDKSKPYIKILQHGLFSKGYNPTAVTGKFGEKTASAVLKLKNNAGFGNTKDSSVNEIWMEAILNSDSYNLVRNGDQKVREIQQMLNKRCYEYCGIKPCDGHASKDTNIGIICLIQKEVGISEEDIKKSNGCFGPKTMELCPNLPDDKRYSKETLKEITRLVQYLLYFNRIGGTEEFSLDGNYDKRTEDNVRNFQRFCKLAPANGMADRKTIMSLLVSTGDPTREAEGCDCATQLDSRKGKELRDAGYKYVGRYLTGCVNEGGKIKDKNLTIEELRELGLVGLRVFPIYQDGGHRKEYFTREQGYKDGLKAIEAANNLCIPKRAVIYVAVDYDFTFDETISRVVPYFGGIKKVMDSKANKNGYVTGGYGARKICEELSKRGLIKFSSVGDISRGYSGNNGYRLPLNWSFDQFTEILFSRNGISFAIDKVAVSGKDKGIEILRSYIFFTTTNKGKENNNDFSKQAAWQKENLEKLGKTVIMVEMNSVEEFIKAWNNLGIIEGKNVGTDMVIIYSHGNERAIMFENGTNTNAITVNGMDRYENNKTGNINDLEPKYIKEFHLFTCNGGNLIFYTKNKENTASVLSKKVINGSVYAYDGNVSFGNSKGGMSVWENRGEGEPRLANNQSGFYEIANKFEIDDAKPLGQVEYKNGEYKP